MLALGAWVLTQIHLIFSVRAVKRDIDSKRTATEAFVSRELMRLETDVKEEIRGIHDAIPPAPTESLEELHGRFDGLIKDMGARLNEIGASLQDLPRALSMRFAQDQGHDSASMHAAVREQAETLNQELEVVHKAMGPPAPGDPRAAIMRAISRPTPAGFAKKNPVAALIVDAGKVKLAEWLQMEGGGPPSVSLSRIKGKGNSEF